MFYYESNILRIIQKCSKNETVIHNWRKKQELFFLAEWHHNYCLSEHSV